MSIRTSRGPTLTRRQSNTTEHTRHAKTLSSGRCTWYHALSSTPFTRLLFLLLVNTLRGAELPSRYSGRQATQSTYELV